MRAQSCHFLRFVLGVLVFLIAGHEASRAATTVTLTFYTTTASHAALGAKMGYFVGVTNTGTSKASVTVTVTLTAPDSTTGTLFTSSPSIPLGGTSQTTANFLTTTYSALTGAFTLTATVTQTSNGTVLATQSIPLTVVAVPANLIYASVGGQGPDTQVIGYTYDFQTVTANLGTTSITVRTQPTLVKPDGTTVGLDAGTLSSISPGTSKITSFMVNTGQYSTTPGTYSVRADVFDSSNTIVATDTHTFTRNALSATTFPPTFTDTAASAGMNVSRTQPTAPLGCGGFLDFIMGGAGAAVADYDGDTYDDVFAVDMVTGTGHLWHNNGNGTFTDMIASSGIPVFPYESGASFADIDNDGHPDLLILMFNGQNQVLHNNGNGTFTNVTAAAGLTTSFAQNNQSATWGDYDNDGYQDLYITVHTDCFALNQNDHLYHNNGNNTFTDVSSLLGGGGSSQLNGRGLAAMFVDYNQDGRVDLYVANDEGVQLWSRPNVLWRNDGSNGAGGWIFTDVSGVSGAGVAVSAMGIGVSDYNRDGMFDLFISNYGANVLLKQKSNATFTPSQGDGIAQAHVQRTTFPEPIPGKPTGSCVNSYTCTSILWSTGFYDFNNDGWEDLYVAGGNTFRTGTLLYPNAFFLNNQDGTFLDLTLMANVPNTVVSDMPTAVFSDFNHDGYVDIFQWGLSGAPRLFMNNGATSGNTNHWLEVQLIGTTSNRDAVGARLSASVNGVNLLRTVYNGGDYQGNSTLVQHFGLGTATTVTTLTITWPDGKVQTLTNVASNQRLVVTEQ